MSQRVYNYRGNLKINIDIDTCTACQLCYDRLPYVFADRGDGIPFVVLKVDLNQIYEELVQVAEDCPSGSILLSWTE
ncbi:MAG: ferredoxin [Aquificaceae bacterium]|nr:ferredoxin [Aquificaceae bacterium]